ncbi:DUF2785 domain-containing protein [Bdellovibrio sp. 22V]|uniref:DUF2785 domain-containing protein n=1 Tax=Bdellovibrio TaxID=958 RepID=UPI0025432E18|nr:DUF2785 domain-containing protein [Bdellovibrio sp. 22V]WII73689.1 DUF2785 domain-containing protein [Bdellovibrio sp. 22V]
MVRRLHTSKILIPLLMTLQGLNAHAMDTNPQLPQKNLISNAVHVQVTQRGMKYFDTRLSEILGNLGVKLDEGYFPAMKYTFDKPINPDDFKDANPEAVKMYGQVRDLLTKWLVGFSMNDHRPTIEIGESGYLAQFSRFGLVTDEKLMRALGKRDGAVLAIELEIKKLTVSTKSVIAWDVNNEFLGKVGLEDVTLQAGDNEIPLRIRLPFYLRMNAYGGLDFEALEIDNNLNSTSLSLQYKKLIVPTFAVEVNGKKFYMNTKELDNLLAAQAPMILQKVRESLGDFARKQLPEMLNEKAKEFLGGSLEQIQDMAPPGAEPTDRRPNFKWGLKLQNIGLKDSLNIDLATYVEDPINSRSVPLKSNASRGVPSFNLIPQANYDIALSVDRGLINRVLQLAFERKNFEQIKQSDGSVLKLVASPVVDYVKTPAGAVLKPQEAFMKMRVAIETKPGSMFLKDTIIVEFDIIAKLRQLSDKSGMQLLLYTIDTDSMFLDDKYISFAGKMFKGKVREGVKDELRKKSAGWKMSDEVLPGSLPLPPQILGIKLDINRVAMDPNGHLVMYLDYAKTGAK